MEFITPGDYVLYLWNDEDGLVIEEYVNKLKQTKDVTVNVENVQRINFAQYEASLFNAIICRNCDCTSGLLQLILKLLKPKGIASILPKNATLPNVAQQLLLAGFVNIKTNNDITCEKPNYEVGSAMKLSFASKQTEAKKQSVWKLDDDDEMIDADDLLDESDKKKPDPASLRVCGTTGKRKACKDCSCGLAEELFAENALKNSEPIQKSSCGSCYLGDAFRCATCPYLGMPAFKPGEKIQLKDNLLNDDI